MLSIASVVDAIVFCCIEVLYDANVVAVSPFVVLCKLPYISGIFVEISVATADVDGFDVV